MLITAGRILTAAGTYLHDGAVLSAGDTIVAVGPRAQIEAQAPAGEERFDYPAATVVPGLIDAHVHLVFDAGPEPLATFLGQDDDELLAAMRDRAEQLVLAGVTTVRDLGDRDGLVARLAEEVADGSTVGPGLVYAGTPLTPPRGHCYFLGGEVSGEAEIRGLVQRNIAAGAHVIKVMETGGGLTKDGAFRSWDRQFSPEDLRFAVDEAHQAGVPVAAHAHGADGIAAAALIGVDTIEHCTWMTPGGGVDLREDVLELIVGKGIHICPTMTANWPMLSKVFGDRAEPMFAAAQRMADAGASLIAGTDAGVQRAAFGGLAGSLGFYHHQLGLSPASVLEMATSRAALALGLGDRVGTVTAGFRADLLVVDGDPLADLAALLKPVAVIARGRYHAPKEAA